MEVLRLALLATPADLPRARAAITTVCETLGLEQQTIERVKASVTEACANCVRHAYDEGSAEEEYVLEARVEQGDLIVRVSDHGRGIDDVDERRLDGGFGFELIEGFSDAHEISRVATGGTCVVLRFALQSS
jgi:anti-sigma regulatory factor (Ser/Thr protein kinase)